MDFIDELKQFSSRVENLKDMLTTEEATKNALILPFFQLMGYDVFNPMEFVPEFTADVGLKKGEKVDYAIILDGSPAILIEAKWCGEPLEKHDSQLFRYFGTTTAKFGILTNGIVYKFYTDLDEPNKMDMTPFLEFDLLNLKESVVPELRRFTKEKIDLDAAFSAANELKYTNLIKSLFARQRSNVDESFVNYVLSEVYDGRRTSNIVEKFTPIVKKAYNGYLNDVINDTLKNAMLAHDDAQTAQTEPEPAPEEKEPVSKIVTTQSELAAYYTIKAILHSTVDPELITYKDTGSYFVITYNNRPSKWICRLRLNDDWKRCSITFPIEEGKQEKLPLNSMDDLYNYTDKFLESVSRFISAEEPE